MKTIVPLGALSLLLGSPQAFAGEYEVSFPTETTGFVEDTTLDEVVPDSSYGDKESFVVGIEKSTSGGAQRALVNFRELFTDAAESLDDGVPYGAEILSAQLVLSVLSFEDEFDSYPDAFRMYAARVLEEWAEQEASWTHASEDVLWSVEGCRSGCSDDESDDAVWAIDKDQLRIDVTSHVAGWAMGEDAQYGLVLYLAASNFSLGDDDESTVVRFEIASSESAKDGPFLDIEFVAPDSDQDGFDVYEDCDDADEAVNPGAKDIPENGIDEDCDGLDAETPELDDTEIDLDDDRYAASIDCDDADPTVFPGAVEICEDDIDQDCDGVDALCEASVREPIPCGCGVGPGTAALWWFGLFGLIRRRR